MIFSFFRKKAQVTRITFVWTYRWDTDQRKKTFKKLKRKREREQEQEQEHEREQERAQEPERVRESIKFCARLVRFCAIDKLLYIFVLVFGQQPQ